MIGEYEAPHNGRFVYCRGLAISGPDVFLVGRSVGRSSSRASNTAPTVTAANASIRRAPKAPDGTGSSSRIAPAAIGSALVNSVARPATVSAAPA
jgi:hypothetical protein